MLGVFFYYFSLTKSNKTQLSKGDEKSSVCHFRRYVRIHESTRTISLYDGAYMIKKKEGS